MGEDFLVGVTDLRKDVFDDPALLFVKERFVLRNEVAAFGVDTDNQRSEFLDLHAPERFRHPEFGPLHVLDDFNVFGTDHGAARGEDAVNGLMRLTFKAN